jgi:hypothetical protein
MSFLSQPLETHLVPDLAATWFKRHTLECAARSPHAAHNDSHKSTADNSGHVSDNIGVSGAAANVGRERNSNGSCQVSNYPVAFHYVRPYEMYVFDYLLYGTRIG